MHRFVDADVGYLRWIATHPDGYVVNLPRGDGGGGPQVLHRATCRTINGAPARGATWTGPYVKVCGDLRELEAAFPAASLKPCGTCSPALQVLVAPPASREWPTRFLRPRDEPIRLPLRPRLESWNRSDHLDQIELKRFLSATAALVLPRIKDLPDPLALRLDIGLPDATPLLDARDLDNYLYPLATQLARLTGREFATVWATKQHGSESFVRIERAVADRTPGDFAAARLLEVHASGQTLDFKQQIHDQLAGLVPMADGPVGLHVAFVIPKGRNWASLWKPAIDSLDPILGRTRPDRDWHPRDGRIVDLALHRHVREDAGSQVTIAIGVMAMHPQVNDSDV